MSITDTTPTANSEQVLRNDAISDKALEKGDLALSQNAYANNGSVLQQVQDTLTQFFTLLKPLRDLVSHLLEWKVRNLDPRHQKDEQHIDEITLLDVDPDINLSGTKYKGSELLKFQIHRVTFKSDKDFQSLADIFNSFQKIADPNVIECIKYSPKGNDLSKLMERDEFRWRVSALRSEGLRNIRDIFKAERFGSYTETIIDILSKRRFDVRIIKINKDVAAGVIDFTVQTLSDHPYGGRRSWRLKKTEIEHQFILETVEINKFPWLPDLIVEVVTKGKDALLNWERFLTRFIKNTDFAAGAVVDYDLLKGKTTYGNLLEFNKNSEIQETFALYPELSEEYNRISI
jgi:hypothetical protein